MNAENYRKHYRGTTITRYEDFKINPEDQKKIEEITAEQSTKETPTQDNPLVPEFLIEIRQIIESIQNQYKLAQNYRLYKEKSLRNKILEEYFKNSLSQSDKKIKRKASNNSITKAPKKKLAHTTSRSKLKVFETKGKQKVLVIPKVSHGIYSSVNLPKLSSRNARGSINSELKANFLV